MNSFSDILYDCTLREGMQSVYGSQFSHELRKDIAERLVQIGIRKIELGSPAAGEMMQESIRQIAAALPGSVEKWVHIRCHPADFETVPENIDAVGIYFGTSDLQMEYSHRKSEAEIIASASDVASRALERGLRVRFTAEDATRTPLERLIRTYSGVIEETRSRIGIYPQVIGIADTTGAATPAQVHDIVSAVRESLPEDITIEYHGHNDRGFAAVNALTALHAGASSVQVSLLGLGERNGITSLCEMVANLELEDPAAVQGLNRKALLDTVRWLGEELGTGAAFREPLSGEGYFADFSGVHANGSANNQKVYHIINPELYGERLRFPINHPLVGKHAIHSAAMQLGLAATGADDRRIATATRLIKERSFRWMLDDPVMSQDEACELLRVVFSDGNAG